MHTLVRKQVAFYAEDRYFSPDIIAIQTLVEMGHIRAEAKLASLI